MDDARREDDDRELERVQERRDDEDGSPVATIGEQPRRYLEYQDESVAGVLGEHDVRHAHTTRLPEESLNDVGEDEVSQDDRNGHDRQVLIGFHGSPRMVVE